MSGVSGEGRHFRAEKSPLMIIPRAVEGHFAHPHGRNWKDITDHVNPILATLAGRDVCAMNPYF